MNSGQVGLVLLTAVGELSNQLKCEAVLAACLNLGHERRAEMLGFSFKPRKPTVTFVGDMLVSETFTVSSHTDQVQITAFSPWSGHLQ